jgi:hypothetical protein
MSRDRLPAQIWKEKSLKDSQKRLKNHGRFRRATLFGSILHSEWKSCVVPGKTKAAVHFVKGISKINGAKEIAHAASTNLARKLTSSDANKSQCTG